MCFNGIIFSCKCTAGCPKKYRCLINNGTKAFCLIFKLPSILVEAYPNLDFESKIVIKLLLKSAEN